MEDQQFFKTVLRHLQNRDCRNYLITLRQREQLAYPIQCRFSEQKLEEHPKLLALSYYALKSQKGYRIDLMIVDQSHICYQFYKSQDFSQQSEDILAGQIGDEFVSKRIRQAICLQQIQKIIKGSILVGHDLGGFLQIVPIIHNAFIDTLTLYPHNLGLPLKSTLEQIYLKLFSKVISAPPLGLFQRGRAALEIVQFHVKNGRGTIEEVRSSKYAVTNYFNFAEIIAQAQLQLQRIVAFYLRGSRALDLIIQNQEYTSDWDYFCVYKCDTEIDGKLIKLWNIDITIYDQKSFARLMDENDISLLQLFFLPKQFQIVNNLKYPNVQIGKLRNSLNYHLSKCDKKLTRFDFTLKPGKRQWKLLKVYHMKIRFIDYFIQLYETKKIDFEFSIKIWKEIQNFYFVTKDFGKAKIKILQKIHSMFSVLKRIDRVINKHKNRAQLFKKPYIEKKIQMPYNNDMNKIQGAEHSSQTLLIRQHAINNNICNPLNLQLVRQLQLFGLLRLQSFRISYNRHKKFTNLIHFHYNQSADFSLSICRQSRGIILDEAQNYSVVSLPYFKFFDYNHRKFSQKEMFDFSQYKIYHKYDGSIACLYQYKGNWEVSSSRVPDGTNWYCFQKSQTQVEFKTQFLKIFKEKGYEMPRAEDKNKTFIFQLLSKDHIIVVLRQTSSLVLHGVIDRVTGKQQDFVPYALKYKWQYAKALGLKIQNFQQIIEITKMLNPLKEEGFILCDRNNVRLKIKSPHYIKANWLAELNLSPDKDPLKYLLQIVVMGQGQLFSEYCPKWSKVIHQYILTIKQLNQFCLNYGKEHKDLKGKELAIEIKKKSSCLRPFLFAICQDPVKWQNRLEQLVTPKRLYEILQQIKMQELQ